MNFGNMIHFRQEENTVFLDFTKGHLEIQVITDEIIRFFSPISDVRPTSKAIAGKKYQKAAFEIKRTNSEVTIFTAHLTVQIQTNGMIDIYGRSGNALCCDYRGNRTPLQNSIGDSANLLCQEGQAANPEDEQHTIQILKKLDGDESFYGLGDKTGFLDKRNYEYECWNTQNLAPHVDSLKALNKSIPFFITLKKDAVFGLFFDNTFRSCFDFGKESDEYYWFGADDGNLDYYFISGSSMKDVVKGYTWLTGTTPLPQMWTLGFHQSRWGYRSEADIRNVADHLRKNNLPCDAIYMDIDYMERYKVFTVDSERFSDLKRLTGDLAKEGLRIVAVIDPGVKAEKGYEIYEQGIENGYFVLSPDGTVYENVVWPGISVFPDFGRKEVRDWWGGQHRRLLEAGVAGIWTDMNEPASFEGELPLDIIFYDEDRKSSHAEMHNVYGHNMVRATYESLRKITGKRPFVITRACYSGTQRYSSSWTGDNHSIWAHLQMAIPQMCNLGLSGMPFTGTDIGGYASDVTGELMCRWIQVGAFSPFCRNHSRAGTRRQEPWNLGEDVTDICRKYLDIRYRLLPYFYDLWKKEEEEGLPIMRPLVLEYENDENVRNLNSQFLIGDSLLVAPVVEPGMTQKLVYLPAGDWYDYWTNEKISGGRYIIRQAPLDTCPIYIKAGSIIPMYTKRLSTMEQESQELILNVYPEDDRPCEYIHYQDNGEDFAYLDGEYNLYRFIVENRNLHTEMLHHGYQKDYIKITLSESSS